jgi:hypothetical protein
MSLNRYEQILYDYISAHPEENRFWQDKVRAAAGEAVRPAAAAGLNQELWDYFVERSGHVPPFSEIASREGLARISMMNLAEFLLSQWAPPQPKRASER